MNRFPALFLFLAAMAVVPAGLRAEAGDTTWVRAHDARDLTWYGAYEERAVFPDGGTPYARVLCYATLGCASGGCSDWDYTVRIHRVDTVAARETELGRLITPYGGYMRLGQKGFDNDWTRTFVYDVTDLASELTGDELIRVFYDGWSSGFSMTLDFAFIEGTPTREVLGLQVPYHSSPSSWGYGNAADFDAAHLPATTLALPAGTAHARLRVTPSGHGFDNNVVCAEFCNRDYTVYMDGAAVATQAMWRDDCGFNPVYPQGGTWLYDRANWCPGSEAWTRLHELPLTPGAGSLDLDIDVESYTWAGAQTPGYIWSTILVAYGPFQVGLDAEIADVIKPSGEYAHARLNPSCDRPEVVLRNNGGDDLTSCTIAYGVQGGPTCYQAWSGNLSYGESETVVLGNVNFDGVDLSDPVFWARVEGPNGGADEAAWNDERRVRFDPVPLYDNRFIVWFRTNARPTENAWTIRDDLGTVVASRASWSGPNQIHADTVDLPNGCYVFEMTDSDEDGLSFFANSDGNGILRFLSVGGGSLYSFEADFGSKAVHAFTTGLPLGSVNSAEACDVTALPSPAPARAELWLSPNPARDRVRVDWAWPSAEGPELTVHDLQGRPVRRERLSGAGAGSRTVSTAGLAPGLYLVRLAAPGRAPVSAKLVVE
jgi:hypothetical protein